MIAERPKMFNKRKGIAEAVATNANELAALYAALSLGEFTAATLADVYATGGEEAHRQYVEAAKEEAAKFRSLALRQSVTQSAEDWQTPFAIKARETYHNATETEREMLQYLTFAESGKVEFTDASAAKLKEDCNEYLTDPEQIAKYRQHSELVRLLNEFFADAKELPTFWFTLFPVNGGKIVMPEHPNYAAFVNRGKDIEDVTPTQQEEDAPTAQQADQTPKQRNRVKGGVVKGIAKMPDYIDHGGESRKQ